MSHPLVRLVAERFERYSSHFLQYPGDDFAYRLKIEHTARVAAIAASITEAEKLTVKMALACRLAALLHDVGRFFQFYQYKTFRDELSVNHAKMSVQRILREGMLEGVPQDIRRLVLGAVYLHNKRRLPDRLSPELQTVARVVRDSDKLDIYSIMTAYFSQETPEHPEVSLDVKDEPALYSPKIIASLLRRESGDYKEIVYVNDFMIMNIGWLYDLNYRESFRQLKARGYLDTLFDLLPQDPTLLAFRQQIALDLAQKLNGA